MPTLRKILDQEYPDLKGAERIVSTNLFYLLPDGLESSFIRKEWAEFVMSVRALSEMVENMNNRIDKEWGDGRVE